MSEGKKISSSELILDTDLEGFFYSQLNSYNQKCVNKIPEEMIIYSSKVMRTFGESQNFSENIEGKVREKVLGTKLLESNNLSPVAQKRELKDIGDTALFLCGFFAESLNKKLIDVRYYQDLGRIAYSRLDKFVPDLFEVPAFFDNLSRTFGTLTILMNHVSSTMNKSNHFPNNSQYFIFEEDSEKKVS
jgi:hypothetical protein